MTRGEDGQGEQTAMGMGEDRWEMLRVNKAPKTWRVQLLPF